LFNATKPLALLLILHLLKTLELLSARHIGYILPFLQSKLQPSKTTLVAHVIIEYLLLLASELKVQLSKKIFFEEDGDVQTNCEPKLFSNRQLIKRILLTAGCLP